ncbi:MAG TPA: carboxypeptidase-like regulatory domain-containing protein, partial [Terriglobales bacterium]|nr:carboxypeptidase-like regulatory domain-containing protein [Terriglobales bacterium]
MRTRRWVLLVFTVLTICPALLWSQSGTASLRGAVSDANGAVLPGAGVTITDPKTGFTRTVQTEGDGTYQLLQLQPSLYTVEVSANGFAKLKRENVQLQVNTPATMNFTMQVSATKVEIEVTTEAPLVNTQDASIGNTFNARQLIDLPAEGRDPAAILSLQPGVTYIGSQVDQSNDSRGGSVAGARSDQTNITWDGLDNNDQLTGNAFSGALRSTLDSLQEFRVTTNSGNADEGRSSGAQVSLVTKSGTNSFHGSLYEYNRNSIGEANDWFNKAAQISTGEANRPPQLIRNTFGAAIGGPIVKDRFFFFAAYEGQRTHETLQTTHVIPSDAFRQGILQYQCTNDGSDPMCTPNTPGPGNPNPFTVVGSPSDAQLVVQLTPDQFANMDPNCTTTCPLGPGVNPLIADPNNSNAVFEKYPHPNTLVGGGDLLNLQGYTFAGANPIKHDTYVVKLDYK